MSEVNPNATQLLQSKYQAYVQLLQARMDIDSKLMIVATDINQITSAVFANSPVGAIPTPTQAPAPEAPAAPAPEVKVEETPVTPTQPKVVTPEPAPEPAPVANTERTSVEYAVIQGLVQELVAAGKTEAIQKIAADAGAPYNSLGEAEKMQMEDSLREVIANG